MEKFLKNDPIIFREDEEDVITTFNIAKAWNKSDFLCCNYILNSLYDELYKVYSINKTNKKLWELLDHKYKTEDVGAKKFLVVKFLNFVMADSKAIVNQVQEFQLIIHGILAEGIVISESFQVAVIIEKLPPTWNDFKNYLKLPKRVRTNKVNVVENIFKEAYDHNLCAMISEVNLVDSNTREWWLDTGATRHIFCDKDFFVKLVPCEKGEKLYMGNAATSKINRKGTMILKITSSKELKL
ncbi:uncharacterized protein [Gossypium hirsutum]|uniref:Retrovirus-related Pol polyprotein from transposon TNT 1-94-like beta-barrel domain-containing protein n=1 Tax=Gossypium hirsutum TaxID=3635 RepID=A0A1U8PVZ5_GOSHI|nr:uncharacterized protein LOC107963241 [Gossypium hirsutum]